MYIFGIHTQQRSNLYNNRDLSLLHLPVAAARLYGSMLSASHEQLSMVVYGAWAERVLGAGWRHVAWSL